MPQNEQFWNPYRMVPVKERIDRRPPATNEKQRGKCGVIYCSLENLTLLFVGKDRHIQERFFTREGRPVIPGSSLKGMLRSLAETVGGGCHVTDSRGTHSAVYKACDDVHRLCIACRMFGMMERRSHARVHTGNVSVGDGLICEKEIRTDLFQVLFGSPATRHQPFYRNPATGNMDGQCRKFYFHQPARVDSVPQIPPNLQSRAINIRALLPGHHFDFEIHFNNLPRDELALLTYVTALEENVPVTVGEEQIRLQGPLRHKVGYAKPLGLGSCRIAIEKIVYFPEPSERFSSLVDSPGMALTGEAVNNEVRSLTLPFVQDNSPTMAQLRKMLVWDENDGRTFRYPDFYWFKNAKNSGTELKPL